MIELVNNYAAQIKSLKEKGLVPFNNISVVFGDSIIYLYVYDRCGNDGYTQCVLKLTIKDDYVYWQNINVGKLEDLLPDYKELHIKQ